MKRSLKTQLSLNIAFVALLTVALISVVSNVFINQQFEIYVEKRQEQRTDSILLDLEQQYEEGAGKWNAEFLHAVGMRALYDGYIIKAYDPLGETLWDAEAHDMSACAQVMEDITRKMRERYPGSSGRFTVKNYDLKRNDQSIAVVSISYFSPYFYNDDDFRFLDSLNAVLAGSGVFSLLLAVTAGWLLARRVSSPIRKTAEIAKQMSGGDYAVRIEEKTNVRELDELTRAVNHLARSLSEQESLRKRLTADVAHELRTPLTNVATHVEAMVEGVWEPTPQRLSSCLEEINRLGKLVSDLENLAKVESGNLKLDKTRVDLLELAKKTLSSFEADIAAKNLSVSAEGCCPEVLVDRDRIRQVLTNLISNAVKHAEGNGAIRVILSETENGALLAVEDDGVGIPRDELPFVFDRFYRVDKSRRRFLGETGGSGIGLAVVKSIVTAHGGVVRAESRLNEGSRFSVSLPSCQKEHEELRPRQTHEEVESCYAKFTF
ncbi:MAG: HAMP domain-containing protein [Synergistaceae bacterium]|jgi:signal transduction histidine kinase|nr:HAMP domain-containing protein [Synergistaceae bacterium]